MGIGTWCATMRRYGSIHMNPNGFAHRGCRNICISRVQMFFVRDPMLFPDLIHAVKRNPKTDMKDANAFWEFFANTPESVHLITFIYGDRGIPASYRNMNGYGNHSFRYRAAQTIESLVVSCCHVASICRLVNDDGKVTYCKFHVKTDDGVKNMTADAAEKARGADPDFCRRDLVDFIASGGEARYTMFVQLIPEEDVLKGLPYNIFDVTKVVPHRDYPLIEVGKLVLNQNVENFFAETEQSAFCPGNLVPGIESSPDRVFQGRLISYSGEAAGAIPGWLPG